MGYAKYEERRDGGVRQSEEVMVKRMRTRTLGPSWSWSKQSCEFIVIT